MIDETKRKIFVPNTPLSEALDRWQQAISELNVLQNRSVEIAVDDSLGRITARPVFAIHSSPFYNASAMDGIATRYLETVGASETTPIILAPDRYVDINTGNAVPQDYDTVIMIEDVRFLRDNSVEIIHGTTPWQHIRTIGEDIVATELILPEGHKIRPIDIGAMLATGVNRIEVHRSPSVAVIPTGSDVVQPGSLVNSGDIIEFNSRILAGYLRQWGADTTRTPIVKDDPDTLSLFLLKQLENHDIIIINAGASVGTKDFTAHVLEKLGDVVVHGVNIKPGKPVILAVVKGKPVIGLPGYPVSAVLTLKIFVKNLIFAAQGIEPEPDETVFATMSRPISSKMGVEDFIRVKLGRVGKSLIATPSGRGAGAVMSMVQADGILRVPASSEGIGAGETVDVELLRNLNEIDNTLVFIGSHDNILDVLANLLHLRRPVIRLSSAHVGSMGGIMAIKRGEAHVAGTHLLDEQSGKYNIPFIRQYLHNIPLLLINLAFREQGLLVAKNNPKSISGFEDLTRKDIIFINRQRGAGTRILTDINLKRLQIRPEQVNGYSREEYTHMNIASAIAAGSADTGLAIRAAAKALDLDFVPVAKERYDLVIPKSFIQDQRVTALLETIREDKRFCDTVKKLGGYDLQESGNIIFEQ